MERHTESLRKLCVFALTAGMLLSGAVNIHAEGDATPQPTDQPAETAVTESTAEPVPAPSEQPATETPAATPAAEDPGVSMYRLYNPNSGEHFYTAAEKEKDYLKTLGWSLEGVGWVGPSQGDPVFRLYNKNGGEHHYTLSEKERDALVAVGWRDEGTGWYSDQAQTVPVYREYNPNQFANNHNYTTSQQEHNTLVSLGWRNENISFYALKAGYEFHYDHGDIPYFMQTDPRWKDQMFGGLTMGNTACGVCTMSMIITAITGQTVLPPEVAQYLYDQGQYNAAEPGTTGTSRLVAAEHWGLKVDKITSKAQLKTALRQGMILSEMTENSFARTTHGVLVFGYDNGRTNVYDPYYSSNNGTYSVDYMWKARTLSSEDYDAGAVIFGFYKD